MNKVQKKFESWAKMQGLRLEQQKNMAGGDMGQYDFGPPQAAFEVWEDAWSEAFESMVVQLPRCWNDAQRDYRDELVKSLTEAGLRYE